MSNAPGVKVAMPSTPVLALVAASVLWGTTGTAASFLPVAVSPVAIGASTMTLGGALLFAASGRSAVAALRDVASRRWLLIGATGVFVYPLAFYSAMSLAGVAIGNVVSLGSGPVFAALLEWIVERRRLARGWAVSTILAIAGVVLLCFSGRADAADSGSLVAGVILGLVAGFSYALYSYCSSRALEGRHSGRGVMGGMFGVGAVALLPVLLVTGAPMLATTTSISIALYLSLGPMFVAYLLFGFALRFIRSSAATTITLLEPVVATVLAVIVVGERLAAPGWLGLLLLLSGVTILVSARQNGKRAEGS